MTPYSKRTRSSIPHSRSVTPAAIAGVNSQGPPRATLVWPNGYKVDELMTTQSGRILLDALDRMVYSSANYRVVMLSDLAATLAFLALGLNRFSGPWVVAGGGESAALDVGQPQAPP
jgi:uncharacterized membrane protein